MSLALIQPPFCTWEAAEEGASALALAAHVRGRNLCHGVRVLPFPVSHSPSQAFGTKSDLLNSIHIVFILLTFLHTLGTQEVVSLELQA